METSNLSNQKTNPDFLFEIGDVVSLKSCGGNMTISYRYRSGAILQYEVLWLDGKGRMQKSLIPEKAIQLASTLQFFPLNPVPCMTTLPTPPMYTYSTSSVVEVRD